MSSLIDCIESGFQTHLPQSLAIGPLHFFARNPPIMFLQIAATTPILMYGMIKLRDRLIGPPQGLLNSQIRQVSNICCAAITGLGSAIMSIIAFKAALHLGCGGAYSSTPIYSAIPTP